MDVYDRTEVEEFVAPLTLVSNQLLGKQIGIKWYQISTCELRIC